MKTVSSQKTEHKKQTIDFKIYLITDRKILIKTPNGSTELAEVSELPHGSQTWVVDRTPNLFTAVEEALKGGIKAVQLREKDLGIRELLAMAYSLRELTDRYSAKLFINDRVDVAVAVEADGVHLGQSSMPAHAAKKASKGNLIVGVSTHSLTEALEAERDGADFITFGPVYQTPSKLRYGEPAGTDSLNKVCKEISIPVFAIGGIKIENLKEVNECGAYGVAVISAILGSDNIKNTAERFMRYRQ